MKKLKILYRNRFGTKLTKEDLRGYRNILKLLYSEKSNKPLENSESSKYFIRQPKLHIDLIITAERAEIINSKYIYPLEINKLVFERAIKKIKEAMNQDLENLENSIKDRKESISFGIYKKIK